MSIIDNILKKRGFVKREDIEDMHDDDIGYGYETKSASFMGDEVASLPQRRPDTQRILDYKTFVEAYRQLPWLFAAGAAISIASRKPTLRIYKEVRTSNGVEQQEVQGEDINERIESPNPDMSYTELIQITALNLFLTGNMYWELVGTRATEPISTTHQPVEIWWVKPESMFPQADVNGVITEYVYTSPQGKEQSIDASRIIHFKQANPGSYFVGLGVCEPLINTATLEIKANTFNKSFLDNDGTPPFVFTHPKEPDKEQRRRFWEDWDARHKGPKKNNRAGMIWGGMDVKPLASGTMKDMQFSEMRKSNREETLAAAGVPPSIVGLLEYANYSNMEVQSKKFWQDTVIPLLDLIADKLTLRFAPLYNEQYWFEFDYTNIEVLQEDDERKSRIAATLVQNGIKTPNEVRREMFNDEPYEGGDNYYMSMSMLPVGMAAGEWWAQQPAEEMTLRRRAAALRAMRRGDDETQALLAARIKNRIEAPVAAVVPAKDTTAAEAPAAAVEPAAHEDEKPVSFWREAERKERLWQSFEKRVSASERALQPEVEKFMRTQAMSVKRACSEFSNINDVTADKLFNVDAETKKYVAKFFARYKQAFERAAEAGLHATKGKLWIPPEERRIKDDDEFHVSAEHLKKLRAQMEIAANHIFSSTWDLIDADIAKATANNMTVEELTQSLWEHLDTYSIEHSRLVARTEMARTENWAGLEGYKENENVDMKGWMCSFVEDSRDAHMKADGQEVALNDDFVVGGERMEYPGDMRGDAGNVCNCLCTTYPVVSVV